jgi:Ca-activated chloride channel homolog
MARPAKGGKGKSHVAKNATEVPSLFVGEARRLMGESIVEEPFRPVVKLATEALAGVDFAKGPALKGFVVSRAKRFSEVLLEAKDHKPLLVQTHHGLGKTVAFLSDVKNRWATDWLAWGGYGKLWAQVVRANIRRDTGEELALRVTREGKEAVVRLTALDAQGRYRNELSPKLRVTEPDGAASVLLLPHAGPGRYQARVSLHAAKAAPYGFELVETPGVSAQQLAKVGAVSLFYAHSDEYRVLPPNEALLKTLSERTGGKFMPKAEEIFANYGDGGSVSRALWQYCAAGALILFLLDILVRRAPSPIARSSTAAPAERIVGRTSQA